MAAPIRYSARQRRRALRFAVIGNVIPIAVATVTSFDSHRLREMTPELGSFSAGSAAWDGRQPLDDLLRRADVALYSAKTNGGGKVEIAPPTLEPSGAFREREPAGD